MVTLPVAVRKQIPVLICEIQFGKLHVSYMNEEYTQRPKQKMRCREEQCKLARFQQWKSQYFLIMILLTIDSSPWLNRQKIQRTILQIN